MNFLAHLHLSGDSPEIIVGNMMGDFVKGRLDERYPGGITKGLELHRRIDTFAGSHPAFMASRRRIDPRFGHYRGILVDLFYDHFLAAEWACFADEAFPAFLARVERILNDYAQILPEQLRARVPDILHEWLPSYREAEGIDLVLRRMARRLSRSNPLGEGGGELIRHYRELRSDFLDFFPDLEAYVAPFIDGGQKRVETP